METYEEKIKWLEKAYKALDFKDMEEGEEARGFILILTGLLDDVEKIKKFLVGEQTGLTHYHKDEENQE